MAITLQLAFFTTVCVSVALASGGNYTCYVCNSLTDGSDCGETFTYSASSNTTDSECEYCKTSLVLGTWFRSCESTCTETDFTVLGIRTYAGCCTSNLCNAAGNISAGTGIILAVLSVIAFFRT